MVNNDFLLFLDGKYKGISQIRKKFPFIYDEINEFNKNFKNIHWGQKLYNYINNITVSPTCICGNTVKFLKFNRGYVRYCSSKCRYGDIILKEEIKQSFIKKFGVENPLQSLEIQEKRKTLFFEKHGVEHQSQLFDVKEKRKRTCLKKFGATTNLVCDDTKEKIKETNLKLFGVEHNSQSFEIKEKKKQTNLKLFGVEYNLQSEEFKNKSKQTCLERYNVEHSSLSNEIREKQLIRRKLNRCNDIIKLLKINENDIEINNNIITIKNYCDNHNSFNITTNLFHQRWYKYDKKICTLCYPIQKQISGSEIELEKYINFLGVNYVSKDKKILKNRFEIDIYFPDHKLGIEFDGLYWHSINFKDKKYHQNKTEECEKQGIQLLHVFEDEWIFKKEIVKSIIKSKLGIIDTKIFARKCEVKEIDNSQMVREFLETNHIQGFVGSSVKIGLFYNNELVSLMTFGKKRLSMGNKERIEGEYEMLRFCNKLNTQVVGGASRMLKYFTTNHQPKSILTFADRRYSNGQLYKKLGFNYLGNTEPNYWYFKNNEMIRYYRFGFRKDVLVKEGYDSNKTESQIMSERGYLSIYDCGNMKFNLLNG